MNPRRGHPKRLADSELVCPAAAQVLLGARSEHHWLRMCYGRLDHRFPYLPKQPGYRKRLKAAAPLTGKRMRQWIESAYDILVARFGDFQAWRARPTR